MYKTEVISSSKELTIREKIKLCEVGDTVSLDTVVPKDGSFDVDVEMFAVIHVENDKSQSKEYDICVIEAKDGTKYKTGSESFINSLCELYDMLEAADELKNGFVIRAYKKPSKNFSGDFITCTLA